MFKCQIIFLQMHNSPTRIMQSPYQMQLSVKKYAAERIADQ